VWVLLIWFRCLPSILFGWWLLENWRIFIIDYIFSQGLKMLVDSLCYLLFSSADSLCALYTTLMRNKLEHASVARNSITSTDSSKLKRVQRQFSALRYSNFLWAHVAIIMKVF
jgi:hypothetical protein